MSKRFTDSEKWRRPWFRSLPVQYKALWSYITDNCDLAGVWYVDMEMASFQVKHDFDQAEAVKVFDKQIEVLGGGKKWFIRDFVEFQYGQLKPTNGLHNAVIRAIQSHKIEGYMWGTTAPQSGAQVKDKVKDKDKAKDSFTPPTVDEVRAYCIERKNRVDPQAFCDHYIARDWKPKGYTARMKDWRAAVRTWEKNATATPAPIDDEYERAKAQARKDAEEYSG